MKKTIRLLFLFFLFANSLALSPAEKLAKLIKDPDFEESVENELNPVEIMWPRDYRHDGVSWRKEMNSVMFHADAKLQSLKITASSNVSITLYLSRGESPTPTDFDFKGNTGRVSSVIILPTDGSVGDFYVGVFPSKEDVAEYTLKIEPSFNWLTIVLLTGALFVYTILRNAALLNYISKRYVYLPTWLAAISVAVISVKMAVQTRVEILAIGAGLYLCFAGYRGRFCALSFSLLYYLMDSDILYVLLKSFYSKSARSGSELFFYLKYNERVIWIFIVTSLSYVLLSEAIYRKEELRQFFKSTRIDFSYWLTNIVWAQTFYFLFSEIRKFSPSLFFLSLAAAALLMAIVTRDMTARRFSVLVLTSVFGSFLLVQYLHGSQKIIARIIWFSCGVGFQIFNGSIECDDFAIDTDASIDAESMEEATVLLYSSSSEENADSLLKMLQLAKQRRQENQEEPWEESVRRAHSQVKQEEGY